MSPASPTWMSEAQSLGSSSDAFPDTFAKNRKGRKTAEPQNDALVDGVKPLHTGVASHLTVSPSFSSSSSAVYRSVSESS